MSVKKAHRRRGGSERSIISSPSDQLKKKLLHQQWTCKTGKGGAFWCDSSHGNGSELWLEKETGENL